MKRGRGTKEKILDAASELFAEKGIHKTRVDEIAERAGVAKGTIYLYVKKKEDLLVLIVQRSIEAMMDRMEALAEAPTAADVSMRAAYEVLYERVSELRQSAALQSLTDFYGLPEEIIQKINEQKMRPLRVIEKIVARGIREKTFRKTVSPKFVAFLVFAFLGALIHKEWIPVGIEPEDAGEQFWRLVSSAMMR